MSSPLISVDRQCWRGAREGDTGGGGDMYGKVGWRYSVVAHERPHTNGRRMKFAVAPDRARLEMAGDGCSQEHFIRYYRRCLEPA